MQLQPPKAVAEGKFYKSRIYVLDFLKGDIKASATDHLREEITTVLGVATPLDEIVVRVESPGGLVHGYGLRQLNCSAFVARESR